MEKYNMNFMDYYNKEKKYFKHVDLNNPVCLYYEPNGFVYWEQAELTLHGTDEQAKTLFSLLNEIEENNPTNKINPGTGYYSENDEALILKGKKQIILISLSYYDSIYANLFKSDEKFTSLFDYLKKLNIKYSLEFYYEYYDQTQAGEANLKLVYDGKTHKMTGTVDLSECGAYEGARFMKSYFEDFDKIEGVDFDILMIANGYQAWDGPQYYSSDDNDEYIDEIEQSIEVKEKIQEIKDRFNKKVKNLKKKLSKNEIKGLELFLTIVYNNLDTMIHMEDVLIQEEILEDSLSEYE